MGNHTMLLRRGHTGGLLLLLCLSVAWFGSGCSGLTASSNNPGNPPPPINISTNPTTSGITASGAMVSWGTNVPGTSQVEYGTTTSYGLSSPLDSSMVTSHSVGLTGLTASTLYHYRVKSKDASGNQAASGDFTFTTTAGSPTPPVISNVAASNITSSGATIGWTTNVVADSQVEYGTTTSYGQSTAVNTNLVTSHSVGLTGLTASTLYHYRVKSKDGSGTLATSGDFTFMTTAGSTPPVISNVAASNITSSGAMIAWTTNVAADSQVDYGPTTSYGTSTPVDANLVTSHSVPLSGLAPSTVYHYRVKSKDASGNLATSGDFTFTTTAGSPTPPVISGVMASGITSAAAVITWTTNVPATSQVDYGTTTSYGQSTAVNASLVTSHAVALTGLSPSTLYHYRAKSADSTGNQAVSGDFTFTTTALSSGGIPPTAGWFSVPNTNLQTVCPPNNFNGYGYAFFDNCNQVIAAWSSGIADTARNRLIIWGGGHNDYYGNEIYAFDLNTLALTRLNNPSPPNTFGGSCITTLSDGNPNSRHTYNTPTYVVHADRMFDFSGSMACGAGDAGDDTWTLNLATLGWKRMDPTNGGRPGDTLGSLAAYDPNSKLVFVHNTAELWSYNYDTNTYQQLNPNASTDYHLTGVVDPVRKLLILFGGTQIRAFSIAAGSNYAMQDWGTQVTGCDAIKNADYPGLAYDPDIDRIVGWAGGNTVYIFNPDTKTCTTQTFSGGPGAQQVDGTHGRWRYFPAFGVFVIANDASQNVFTLRLTAASSTGATTISAVTASGISGTGAVVTWVTNNPASSQVDYGTTTSYGSSSPLDATLTTSHSVTLTGLTPSTLYHFRVKSTDSSANLVVSGDFTFTTAAN